jgi:exosortase
MMRNTSATTSSQEYKHNRARSPYEFSIVPFFILTFFSYYPVLRDLGQSAIHNELAHHTPLVFALALFLIYRDRKSLARLFRDKSGTGPISPFVAGLFLNVAGQALGIMYLSQLSFPLTLYGMILYLKGPLVVRGLIFPLSFLFFAFPIPGKIYFEVVFPLKLFVTKVAAGILTHIGYNVHSEGNIIQISSTVIGVSDACSGLNSLMAMLTLSTFYTALVIRRMIYKVVIVLSMFPLVMAVNVVRVTMTCLVAVTWGDELASGKLHMLWGVFVFAASVIGLMAITKFFIIIEGKTKHG